MRKAPLVAAVFLLVAGVAHADQPQMTVGGTSKPASITPITLGTSPQFLLAQAMNEVNELYVENESTTQTVAICFAPPNAPSGVSCPGGPGINAGGSFTIPPGGFRIWGTNGGNVPVNAIWGIASAGGTPMTIERE